MAEIAFTAPHHAASQAGYDVLNAGGSAIEAMVCAAAAIAVAYPHMNSLGGDGFWLIHRPGEAPVAIDACGISAALATPSFYQGESHIPERGGRACVTLGGTLAGWELALASDPDRQFSLEHLLAPARTLAEEGITVTESLVRASHKTFEALHGLPAFAELFLDDGKVLTVGNRLRNPGMVKLLDDLAAQGLESAYRGQIASTICATLEREGSPLRLTDYAAYQAKTVTPLSVTTRHGQLYNLPAPTQGIASLIILALYDRLWRSDWSEAERVHHLVECIKQAFLVRDREVTDPSRLSERWHELLTDQSLDALAAKVDPAQALDWPRPSAAGDTIWMGAVDKQGTMVSFIQSVYWEFGSGVVVPEYGLIMNNRGTSFSLDPRHPNALKPGVRPFHTLNPAMALFSDGRRLAYGTMGGEGQPQTQAAVFSRYAYEGLSLEEAIEQGRWLLGRTWGEVSHSLKLEADLAAMINAELMALGHETSEVPVRSELMGHAGAVLCHADGRADSATDPRSDGAALQGRASG
ncbi:gamma-glutamyltransferase family protein [Pokkaliibacter sp. CJK22405]|uniref:gamma-glutamyltransferase family protein n=1 Tax=Pokkaliibacter sp. CJK22405 TaxID=3384615 RepID=UPI003984EEEF